MQNPKISIIIPTHDRRSSVNRLLKALIEQQFPAEAIEVIVVCDGCTDDTVLFLQHIRTPYTLLYLETPGMGAAYARHQGVLQATGALLIFLDDDIDPSPKMIESFYTEVTKEKDVGIGYLLLEENNDKSWNRLYLNYWWENHFYELAKPDHESSFEDVTSGGLCLHRTFYMDVGGFDTRFKCREDYEFGFRLLKAGARFIFSKMFLGIHCDNVSDQQRLHRRKELEGFWDIEMVHKHPELWTHLFLRSIYFTKGWNRWFIWLAFYMPDFGRWFFKKMYKRQLWMERNHFRISWLKAEARQHRFHYALGVSKHFASSAIFNEWVEAIKRDFPIEDRQPKYDQLYFANRWLEHHKVNGKMPLLLAEPLRRFLAFEYFKFCTHNEPKPPKPPVSIIVCSKDRTDLLKDCLQAIFELDYPTKEIIVVDNTQSSSECFDYCKHLPVRYILEPVKGLDNARNTGISAASHELIAFTDDDARPDKDWLNKLVQHFTDEEVMCVTGNVAAWSLQTKAERLFEFNYGGMGHGFKQKRFNGSVLSSIEKLNAAAIGVGANMAFRRKWFDIGGYFDPHLDVGTPSGGGGDVEMFHRVVAKGYHLVYEPAALVWHLHRSDFNGLKRQVYMNGRSYYYYLTTVYRKKTVPRGAVLYFMLFHWIWGWLLRNLLFSKIISGRLLVYEWKGLLNASIDLQRQHSHKSQFSQNSPNL